MRLIALLNWYDEPAWCLTELVASLASAGVDHLVAVDGAYALFPGGRARSAPEQWLALRAAAHGAGMGLTMHDAGDLWPGNEVEKRTLAFELGHRIAEPGRDWFYIADADEVVTEAFGVRDALERATRDAGEVVLDQITDAGHQGQLLIRKLFRAQPTGIHLHGNHYTYMSGDGRMLWQGMYGNHPTLVPAENLHFMRIEHRQMHRAPARVDARDRYYRARHDTNAELQAT